MSEEAKRFMRKWNKRYGREVRQAFKVGGRKGEAELRRLGRLFRLEWQKFDAGGLGPA